MPGPDPESAAPIQGIPLGLGRAEEASFRWPSAARRRSRLAALGQLLEDDSAKVWSTVRRELEAAGKGALPTLRKATRSASPGVRGRARTILVGLAKENALRRLIRYLCADSHDLETGLFLLARHHTPGLDTRPYRIALDKMGEEVARRMALKPPGIDRALTLVEYLGGDLQFSGSEGEFHHPDNIHLHRVIERKGGMPLTLCAIYALVAKRCGVQVGLMPLPGHVMLRLREGPKSVIVDPYHGGDVRSQRDCLEYLVQHKLPFQPSWFRDADDLSMIRRQLLNLQHSCEKRGLKRDARGLKRVLSVAAAHSEAP